MQVPATSRHARGKSPVKHLSRPADIQPPGAITPTARNPSSVSKPPVHKPASSNGDKRQQDKQSTAVPAAKPDLSQHKPIPFTQTAPKLGNAAGAQQQAPAITFMPAAVQMDAHSSSTKDEQGASSPFAAVGNVADSSVPPTDVVNNGKHPVSLDSMQAGQDLPASAAPHHTPLTSGPHNFSPKAAASDTSSSDQQESANSKPGHTVVIEQQPLREPATVSTQVSQSEASLAEESSADRPEPASDDTGASVSSMQPEDSTAMPEQTAIVTAHQAHIAVQPHALESPFSSTASAATQPAVPSAEQATPAEADATLLQSAPDVPSTELQLTQREDSQAQAAAVAEAIKRAAQLSAPAPTQGSARYQDQHFSFAVVSTPSTLAYLWHSVRLLCFCNCCHVYNSQCTSLMNYYCWSLAGAINDLQWCRLCTGGYSWA